MKFIVSSSELFSYLQIISKVVPSRSVIPLVENFLFSISSDGLEITATDLETTMMLNLELDNVEGEGSVAIEAKRLLDILKEFSAQPLIFEINEENYEVVIKSETGKYSIPGNSNVDEFPEITEINPEKINEFVLPASTLQRGINYTFFAISEDELRPIMNGINIIAAQDSLTFVSSDSHKLIKFQRTDFKSEMEASFVLPKKPAEILRAILSKTDSDVSIRFDDKNAIFKLSNYILICRLIEGQFPNFEAIMPQNNDKEACVNRSLFHNTIRRVSLFANEASKLVKFNFDNNELQITAQDIDFSISAHEKINCLYDNEPINIGFKSTFLLDVLQNTDSDDVTISMNNKKTAVLVYPTENEENEDVVMLVMPLTLDD